LVCAPVLHREMGGYRGVARHRLHLPSRYPDPVSHRSAVLPLAKPGQHAGA
jgi:hypothetical protein